MANPIGTFAVAPGTTIGPNLTWGFICGEALASQRRYEHANELKPIGVK